MLRLFQAGDRDVFRRLVGPEIPRLRAFGIRLCGRPDLADDLCQEVLLKAFRGCGSFRGEGSLRSWLFRIAARLAHDPRRFSGEEPALVQEGSNPVVIAPDPGPLETATGREFQARLELVLHELPFRQSAAMHLRAVEGFDYERIGTVLGCSNGAARMLVLEARRRLMSTFGKELES
ncbi:MAG: RNA polymerase sigma factor [Planctomycetota bacterium]